MEKAPPLNSHLADYVFHDPLSTIYVAIVARVHIVEQDPKLRLDGRREIKAKMCCGLTLHFIPSLITLQQWELDLERTKNRPDFVSPLRRPSQPPLVCLECNAQFYESEIAS